MTHYCLFLVFFKVKMSSLRCFYVFLRRKSPLKCLFGLQNLDSDRLKRQNRQVKLESILTSFDKFTLLFACYSLFYSLFIAFRPIYTMLRLICRNSDDFLTNYDGFRRDEAESQGGGGEGSGKMMDFWWFPAIFDGFWPTGTWKMDQSSLLHHIQGIMDY